MNPAGAKLIHTTIVATLGPASSDEAVLRRLIQAGTGVFRLNFSHGTLDGHAAILRRVRAAAGEAGATVAMLGDLAGPKIRLGEVQEGGIALEPGHSLIIQRQPVVGRPGRVNTNYQAFVDEVHIGHRILIDDGAVQLLVLEKSADEVICRCTDGGLLTSRKGVNLPDTHLSVPALTDYDRQCADWAVDHELDYLALSFVRRADELFELRERLLSRGAEIPLIAKVEKREAVENIGPIIQASDAIMVARGDLGVEMDAAQVPVIQKELIHRCRQAGRPVIVATQMLQSMIASPTPTRAEVSDVANAIYDGTDAVMLSGETSIGQFPVESVAMMGRIAAATERAIQSRPDTDPADPSPQGREDAREAAIVRGACEMARNLHFKLIAAWSPSGLVARMFSKLRCRPPVIAVSSDPRVLRRMALFYGIRPTHMVSPPTLGELVRSIDRLLVDQGLAAAGDPVLIVGSTTPPEPRKANAVIAHQIGRVEL